MEIRYSKQAVKFLSKQDKRNHMNDDDAKKVWNFVVENLSSRTWNDIEEIEPDEWDLKMLEEIDKNPDCHEFISQDELLKKLLLFTP